MWGELPPGYRTDHVRGRVTERAAPTTRCIFTASRSVPKHKVVFYVRFLKVSSDHQYVTHNVLSAMELVSPTGVNTTTRSTASVAQLLDRADHDLPAIMALRQEMNQLTQMVAQMRENMTLKRKRQWDTESSFSDFWDLSDLSDLSTSLAPSRPSTSFLSAPSATCTAISKSRRACICSRCQGFGNAWRPLTPESADESPTAAVKRRRI